jgi:hypothetical protein
MRKLQESEMERRQVSYRTNGSKRVRNWLGKKGSEEHGDALADPAGAVLLLPDPRETLDKLGSKLLLTKVGTGLDDHRKDLRGGRQHNVKVSRGREELELQRSQQKERKRTDIPRSEVTPRRGCSYASLLSRPGFGEDGS